MQQDDAIYIHSKRTFQQFRNKNFLYPQKKVKQF